MIEIPDNIFAKDKHGRSLCPRCKQIIAECDCPGLEDSRNGEILAAIRIQKCQKGKLITEVTNMPPDAAFLKNLTKELKHKLGTGGKYEIIADKGVIILQGDRSRQVSDCLTKKNIQVTFR